MMRPRSAHHRLGMAPFGDPAPAPGGTPSGCASCLGTSAECSAPSAPPGGAAGPWRAPSLPPCGLRPARCAVAAVLARARSAGLGLSPPGLARRPAPRAPRCPGSWPLRAAPGAAHGAWGRPARRCGLRASPLGCCGLPAARPGPQRGPLRCALRAPLRGSGLLPPGGAGAALPPLFASAPPGARAVQENETYCAARDSGPGAL